MTRKFDDRPVIYLHPGEFHFSKSPEVVATVLGSCISVTMYVKRLKLSAISHAMMPDTMETGLEDNAVNQYRYVNSSILNMVDLFSPYKVDPAEIEVKLFGGATQFGSKVENESSIGAQNIRVALDTLARNNLSISASDLGGNRGRKIFFVTDTGKIFLKRFNEKKRQAKIRR